MNNSCKQKIKDIVENLVAGNYKKIVQDGCAGRLTAREMDTVISEYGRHLIHLPCNAFDIADIYKIQNCSDAWAIDLPLWTEEEGRSDLTLSITAKEKNGKVLIEIDDLHVL